MEVLGNESWFGYHKTLYDVNKMELKTKEEPDQ